MHTLSRPANRIGVFDYGLGRAFFATTMVALGIIGLIQGGFTPTWSGIPRSVPARQALAYLCALISLATGIGLLLQPAALIASSVLLTWLVGWLLLVRVPWVIMAPAGLNPWWSLGDTCMMLAAAWVLYAWFAGARDTQRLRFAAGDSGLRIARVFYGLGLIPLGVAHFINLKATADLVPAWLPWHTAWACFTGGAFIAAGVALLTGVYSRLAAALSAVQMGLFTLIIWVPVVLAGPNAFQWEEFVGSWALTAAGWVVADSFRGMRWL